MSLEAARNVEVVDTEVVLVKMVAVGMMLP